MRQLWAFFLTLVMVVPPLFFAYTYTGPYAWLSEAQLALMNEYSPTLSFLVTLLGWLLLFGFAGSLVQRARGVQATTVQVTRGQDALFARQLPIIVALVTLSFAGLAAYYFRAATAQPQPRPVPIADLSGHWWLPATYLHIDGAVIDPARSFTIRENFFNTTYAALVPPDYRPGDPIYAFVEIPEARLHDAPADPALLTTGVVNFSGLPGMIRTQFARAGMPPSHLHLVILYGSTPNELPSFAWLYVGVAVVAAALGSWTIVKIRRQQRLVQGTFPAPPPQ